VKRSREDAHQRMIPIHEKLLPLLVESNALGCELERDAVERHSPPELLRQQMRDERRREDAALVDHLRRVGRDERGRLVVGGDLVGRARHHDADGAAAAAAEQAALLEADALGVAFERRVQDLDALFGDVELSNVATAGRLLLGARGPPVVVAG